MRTYFNTVVSGNVFGYGQDRVVSSLNTCARAAQHLLAWHAGHLRALERGLKRRSSQAADLAKAVSMASGMICLAIMGPRWRPVRLASPVLVVA